MVASDRMSANRRNFLALAGAAAVTPVVRAQGANSPKLRILVLHGPNLDILGRREPQIYGSTTLAQINETLQVLAKEINVELIAMQSNEEGALVNAFHAHMDDADAALINAAGYSFNSVAIHDAIKAIKDMASSACFCAQACALVIWGVVVVARI